MKKFPTYGTNKPSCSWLDFQIEKIHWLFFLLLEGLTAFFYSFGLKSPFQFDDVAHITKHFAIRHDNPLNRWWYNRRWVGDEINALNFKHGGFAPEYYRTTNLIIHMLCGALIYYLVLIMCDKLENSLTKKYRHFIALCTAGFFLLHPLQTQAVSYVIQARIEGIASLFILLNLFLFVQYVQAASTGRKIITASTLIATTILSAGTKEIFVLAPILMFLIDLFFFSTSSIKKVLKSRWIFYALYSGLIIGLVFWYLLDYAKILTPSNIPSLHDSISGYFNNQNNLGNILTHDPTVHITPLTFLMSQFRTIMHYIALIFVPLTMSVEYDWKLAQKFFSPEVLIPLTQILLIIAGAIYAIIHRKMLLVGFGIAWFFIVVAPRSSIIPSAELVCDYKSYLAVAGIFMALSFLLAALIEKIKTSYASLPKHAYTLPIHAGAFILLFLPLGGLTYIRNLVWTSQEAFWADCVKKAPNKARTQNNYGVGLCEAGKFELAIKHYNIAINLDPLYQDPLNNIAVAYSMIGRSDLAIASLQKAIEISPEYPEAYNNLASVYIEQKNIDQAEKLLKKAISLRAYYGKAYFNMARVCDARNDHEGVVTNLIKASEGDLDVVPEVYTKLGLSFCKIQRFEEAVGAFKKAIDLGDSSPKGWFNYANALQLNNQQALALPIYEQLFAQDSADVRYANNLGECYVSLNEYEKALAVFDQMLKKNLNAGQIVFRIATCYEKMNQYDQAKAFLARIDDTGTPKEFSSHLKKEIVRLDTEAKRVGIETALNQTGSVSLQALKTLANPIKAT